MIYGSVCSGIEAATVAWEPLGWKPSFFSEIEAFPRAVLQHHYPNVPLHGDFTTIKENEYEPIQLLVGGTPCQSFSIAGLRGGLDDDRGNLALEFLRLADRTRPRWLVWENVPGVLSSNGGRDFGSIVGGMVQLGYGIAYRILDAQYFGVAQRRRRVFVVGYLGDWCRAAAVLFARQSLSGYLAPRRDSGKETSEWPAQCTPTLNSSFGKKLGLENQHIQGGGDCLSVAQCLTTGTGQRYDPETEKLIPTRGGYFDVTAFAHQQGGSFGFHADQNRALTLQCHQTQAVATSTQVRRLTPRECERLQGFPDDYSLVPNRGKPAADGPRYKALGNSMAVPVMRWIGRRIDTIERLYPQPTP
jgi:DNA (cytosine-5)-methyltransferase 1